MCDVEITNTKHNFLREHFHNELYVGGFYTKVKSHRENDVIVLDEATLRAVCTTSNPADDELKIRVVEE